MGFFASECWGRGVWPAQAPQEGTKGKEPVAETGVRKEQRNLTWNPRGVSCCSASHHWPASSHGSVWKHLLATPFWEHPSEHRQAAQLVPKSNTYCTCWRRMGLHVCLIKNPGITCTTWKLWFGFLESGPSATPSSKATSRYLKINLNKLSIWLK